MGQCIGAKKTAYYFVHKDVCKKQKTLPQFVEIQLHLAISVLKPIKL